MVQTPAVNYDQTADNYAAHRQLHGGVFRELCTRTTLDPGARVLEVGCGTGNYIAALAQTSGCTAYGLDPSIEMLSRVLPHVADACATGEVADRGRLNVQLAQIRQPGQQQKSAVALVEPTLAAHR